MTKRRKMVKAEMQDKHIVVRVKQQKVVQYVPCLNHGHCRHVPYFFSTYLKILLRLIVTIVIVVPQRPSSYGFAPIISTRRSRTRTPIVSITNSNTKTRVTNLWMVRNIDLVEALFFYGDDSIFFSTSTSDQEDQDQYQLLPGVASLIEECVRDDTAIVMLLDHQRQEIEFQKKKQLIVDSTPSLKKNNPNILYVRQSTVIPPNPADLYNCINDDDDGKDGDYGNDDDTRSSGCITIQPKGFGGSSGFGTKNADPERPPLPRHCVVLCTTIEQCRAARSVGMRCLSLVDNDIADAVVGYAVEKDDIDPLEGWSSITMDDIATPGSFWLNVCHPRDDEGNKADPVAIIKSYNQDDSRRNSDFSKVDDNKNNSNNTNTNEEPSDDELAAILADMDPL